MRIVRTNGNRNVLNPFVELERLFNVALGGAAEAATAERPWAPAVDVVETPEQLEVIMDLPGVKQEAIDLSLENGVLTVTAERTEPKFEGTLYHLTERRFGKYERTFKLPANVDGERVSARYVDGVLTITLPKREEAKPRKITINA